KIQGHCVISGGAVSFCVRANKRQAGGFITPLRPPIRFSGRTSFSKRRKHGPFKRMGARGASPSHQFPQCKLIANRSGRTFLTAGHTSCSKVAFEPLVGRTFLTAGHTSCSKVALDPLIGRTFLTAGHA